MGRLKLSLAFLISVATAGAAETVDVKYRGVIPLDRFTCSSIERSSFIRRVCYDGADAYMVVRLNETYYHYCDIDKATVDALLNAESMGRFFNTSIKGHCGAEFPGLCLLLPRDSECAFEVCFRFHFIRLGRKQSEFASDLKNWGLAPLFFILAPFLVARVVALAARKYCQSEREGDL